MWSWMLMMSLAAVPAGAPPENVRIDAAQVARLAAWARTYGYFRWFHPTDELAAVDQNALACLGAHRALEATTDLELAAALRELYGPLAPSASLWNRTETAPPVVPIPEADAGSWTAWMHRGVGVDGGSPLYSSARLGRPHETPAWSDQPGMLRRTVPAEWDGLPFRYTARVRVLEGQAQLWLRTEGGDERVVDQMQDRPIRADAWAVYTIEGTIPAGTETLSFGLRVPGVGTVEIDDAAVEVQQDGTWTPVRLPNGDFEAGTRRWEADSPAYRYTSVSHDDGEALQIARKMVSVSARFERLPERDATIRSELPAGLTVHIPIVLPFDAMGTLPRGDLAALEAALGAVSCADPTRVQTRLAAVAIAWNIHQHFHPYLDVVDAGWDQALPEALTGALEATTPFAFREVLERMTARLQDGHVGVQGGIGPMGYLPLRVAGVDGEAVVVASGMEGIAPGDVLQTVDGKSVSTLWAESAALLSGSPQRVSIRAVNSVLAGPRDTEVELGVGTASGEPLTVMGRYSRGWWPTHAHPPIRTLDSGVMVVDLTRVEWADLQPALRALRRAPGVVVDMRGYPGEAAKNFLPHVLEAPTDTDWMFVSERTHPDRRGPVSWYSGAWSLRPKRPHIDQTVWITDAHAISYAESVMGFVGDLQLGPIVGGATAGANGNVNPYTLPGGYRISWTAMKVLNRDGSQHHVLGVLPTHPVRPTREGIRDGRDELLEAALELLEAETP